MFISYAYLIVYFEGENSFAETISISGSQKWDQLSRGATPGSSVDLEWENEIGIIIYFKLIVTKFIWSS